MKTSEAVSSDPSECDNASVWVGDCHGLSEVPVGQVRDYYAGQGLVLLIALATAAIFALYSLVQMGGA